MTERSSSDPIYTPGTPEYEQAMKNYKETGSADGAGGDGAGQDGPTMNTQGQTPEQQKAANEAARLRAEAEAEAARLRAEAEARHRAINSKFEYGGWAGGAHEAANRYALTGAQAQGRQGEQIDYSKADYDRAQGASARMDQGSRRIRSPAMTDQDIRG